MKKTLIACALALMCACNNGSAMGGDYSPPSGSISHVVYIVLENQDYENAVADPYLKDLASRGALFTNFKATTHPSYPNYLSMVAGDTFGIHSDSQHDLDATSIADLLENKGLTWRNYAEGYPGNCFLGNSSGRYARKHAPFASFVSIQNSPSRCANIVEAGEFQKDLDSGRLPTFSFYSPNLDDDGHDTGLGTASTWLKSFLEPVLAKPEVMKNTLVVVTFDEGGFFSSNQIYTVFLGGMVKPGSQDAQSTNFYSVLRTIEESLGLGLLGRNDSSTEMVHQIWQQPL